MKFFIDTADLDEIAEAKSWGCLAGVTTNPTLYARTGGKLADFEPHMLKIAGLCEGLPVSAESTANTAEGMIEEGRRLAALAPNIVVKLPVCEAGLAACRTLADEGIRINMTLVFSAPQALMAANAGARYISPFVGRFDDIAEDGISQLADVVACIGNYDRRRYRHRAVRRAQEVPQAPADRPGSRLLRGRLGEGRERLVKAGAGRALPAMKSAGARSRRRIFLS